MAGPVSILAALVALASLAAAQNYEMTFQIKEESPKDTFIGNLTSNFEFFSDIPKEDTGFITFSFLQQTYVQTILDLHKNTGVLSTSTKIDRESKNICQLQATCSLNFDVAVRSSRPQSSFFAIVSVTLVIEDINDNEPTFPVPTLNLEISESTIVGTSFHIDSAVDLDSGMFSVQGYEIINQDGDFGLDVVRKLDGSFTVRIVLNTPLDREQKDRYKVVIAAMDGGTPRKFGAVTVNVTVTDVNDNAPIFTKQSYSVQVKENMTLGVTILKLTAEDSDIGDNGKVTYRLSQIQRDARVINIFTISGRKGELALKSRLVYDSETTYEIIVEATDNGRQPQVTQVIVLVNVLDVGNNPPTLQINLLSAGNSKIKNLPESASAGTFVAHIDVNDKDTGANGEVDCEISDRKFQMLRMKGKGYKVVVNGTLDRELQDLHVVRVSCYDHGTPPLMASSSFMVKLMDENDSPPQFIRREFTGSIPENLANFRTFVQVSATDRDLGLNGEVRYYVDRESTHYNFSIDERNGNLRPDQLFDRESEPEIVFRVIARDLGEPRLSSYAMVRLTITDTNDNVPTILEPREFSVLENKHSDTFVTQLKGHDEDEGNNAKLLFKIDTAFEDVVPFVIFPDGIIKTNTQLDREYQSSYTFGVLVFDQGPPRLTGSANITIRISDENDNKPFFLFPRVKNDTAVIYSETKPSHLIAQIEVKDPDEGMKAALTYGIVSGNEDNLFVIDDQVGRIYLTKSIIVKENKTIMLKISVRDGGEPQLSAQATLRVVVAVSNATALGLGEEPGNNTLIVIIVVILTIVLSIIMITVICFLRQFDHRSKARKDLQIVAPDEKYPPCYLDDTTRYLDNSTCSNDQLTLSYDPLASMTGTKKKEVSFDVDEVSHHSDSRDMHNTTMSTFAMPEPEKLPPPQSPDTPSVDETDAGRLNKLQLLQFHQAVLESQTRAWLQSQELAEESSSFDVTLPDDKYSDTSEEVTASDSGKGGSEDDIPSNHTKDAKFKNGAGASSKFQTHHYVAPEFRRQGSLQRKACNINFEDLKIQSPSRSRSPVVPIPTVPLPGSASDILNRPDSRASLTHSTPRSNSRAGMFYPPHDMNTNRTLDSAGDLSGDWDAASYV